MKLILCLAACLSFAAGKPVVPVVYYQPTSYATPYFVQTTGGQGVVPYVQGQVPYVQGQVPYVQGQVPYVRGQVPGVPGVLPVPTLNYQVPSVQSVGPVPVVKTSGQQVLAPLSTNQGQQVQVLSPVQTPTNVVRTPEAFAVKRFFGQGDDGSYTFGYNEGPSSRVETADRFGNKVGGFNYVDSYGKVQSRYYTVGKGGVTVTGSDIPVAPQVTGGVQAVDVDSSSLVRAKRSADPAFFTAIAERAGTVRFQVPYPQVANPIVNPSVRSAGTVVGPSSFGINPVLNPVATSVVNPTLVPTTYNTVQTPGTYYGVLSPVQYSGVPFPVQYSGVPVPVQYSGVQPVVPVGAQVTSYKAGVLSETQHGENTVSYRVDA